MEEPLKHIRRSLSSNQAAMEWESRESDKTILQQNLCLNNAKKTFIDMRREFNCRQLINSPFSEVRLLFISIAVTLKSLNLSDY